MEQYPMVLVGDFNARPDGQVYATVTQTLSDPHVTAAKKLNNAQFTYDKYGTEEDPRRLDYMFYNDFLVANSYRVMIDLYNGYISDHYGVTTQYSYAP
jgi:endonuclease/exonuclease/phosphatase family metal-dependent hydrolase